VRWPVSEDAARRGIDHLLARVAWIVLHGFFREIEVDGRDRLPAEGPALVVLNHFNGLVDPIVAVHTLDRMPRFIAKATLWKVVILRPFLALAGLIPVYRTEDRKIDARNAAAGNVSAFAACHEVLRDGGTVAIFPEGTTSARSQLAPVKTGAARIALGAVAEGIEGLVVVPVGLAYEDRVAFRGRAYAEIGEPLDVTAELPNFVDSGEEVSEENRTAVERLTEAIDARLRACSPDFETPREEATLQVAAKVALRPNGPTEHEPSFGEVEQTARRLAQAGAETRHGVIASVADYALDLRLSHLQDAEITPGPGLVNRFRKAVATIILLVVLLPIIILGILANIVPFLLVRLVSRRVRVPVTKGTVRMLVGFVVFPITWIVLAIIFADTYRAVLLFLAFPVFGFLALWALETTVLNWRMLSAWRAARGERRWFADQLRDDRAALAHQVQAVLDEAAASDVVGDQAP
jgi:glycerol-3-phosphate O-acyltransferase/dihydroxyacetone phosphate acyltransferase